MPLQRWFDWQTLQDACTSYVVSCFWSSSSWCPSGVACHWTTYGDCLVYWYWRYWRLHGTRIFVTKSTGSDDAGPQNELSMCIQDFLHVTCKCSPSILISKPKFHFLVHLPMYIRCFGPAVLFSTERYESFNAVFRFSSIYSNHLAPSRDIARSFTSMDSVKHVVTGGFWSDEQTGQWLRASPNVLNHILNHPYHAALVGLPTEKPRCPGTFIF